MFSRDFADRFFGRKKAILQSDEILDFEDKWREIHIKKGPYTKGSRIDGGEITRQI